MGDAQDSTELLLQKARERRTRNAEAAFLKRERTGPEKMCKYINCKNLLNLQILGIIHVLVNNSMF